MKIYSMSSYNCFQNIVYSLAKYYKTNYEMMFLELWGFSYKKSLNSNFGERLGLCWSGELERRNQLLSKFHGISFYQYENIREIDNKIIENKKLVACVYIDSYDCAWLPFYNKIHRQHICVVEQKKGNYYYCKDASCSNGSYLKLDAVDIEKNSGKALLFYHNKIRDINSDDIKSELHRAADFWSTRDMRVQMDMFFSEFAESFTMKTEFCNISDPVSSRFIMTLKNLADDRNNLCELFRYVSCSYGLSIGEICECLENISTIYEKSRAYLVKCFFCRKEADVQKITNDFNQIKSLEDKIISFVRGIN